MCLKPATMDNGAQVSCRNCWQCREAAINDWVGRNIAESRTSKASHAITLTYGRNASGDADHERSVLLTYHDVQKYLKRYRRQGFPLRYFVAGEFGTMKGRAHWHLILHWQERVPPGRPLGKMLLDENWIHGWSWWKAPGVASFKYAAKYVMKAQRVGMDRREGVEMYEPVRMSKKPPLGADYFAGLARTIVRAGLAPQDLTYSFPEVAMMRRGRPDGVQVYRLRDRSAELYLLSYIGAWDALQPGRSRPQSFLVDSFERYGVLAETEEELDRLLAEERERDFDKRTEEHVAELKAAREREAEVERLRWLTVLDQERELRRGSR